ncbi:MAG: nicotinamide-nucleotide amidohydrolase family protein, partial [Finegoldia magna]|nr:nicotinamide-nucleotide amidohydrolase family protein [Finegoldia magna]
DCLGKEMVLNEKSYAKLRKYFNEDEKAIQGNIKQCMFPEDAIVFENFNGTADCALIEKNEKKILFLPGPPAEMKPIYENQVQQVLEQFATDCIISETLNISILGEWDMNERVKDIIESSNNPTVAPYFKKDKRILRITAKASDRKKALDMISKKKQELRDRLGVYVFGENDETIEESVYMVLKENDLSIMTSESITGGMIASKLVNVSGVSDYLKRSLVVYSNEAKIELLGVNAETIDKYGVVSENVAHEMVERMFEKFGVDCAISTTGFASGENAGLVFVGLGYKNEIKTLKLQLHGERNKIRNRVSNRTLAELRLMILENVSRETF